MNFTSKIFSNLILTSIAFSLTSCGGGGGGGSVSGAAFVTIQSRPSSIDSGDRTTVEIKISDIHDNGIALKVKYPGELKFVESSAEIAEDGDDERSIAPDVLSTSDTDNFLVFYVDADDFGDNGRGTLTFELQGVESTDDALIEVDPDVDDPLIDNAIEFNAEEPQFEAEDQTSIRVKG